MQTAHSIATESCVLQLKFPNCTMSSFKSKLTNLNQKCRLQITIEVIYKQKNIATGFLPRILGLIIKYTQTRERTRNLPSHPGKPAEHLQYLQSPLQSPHAELKPFLSLIPLRLNMKKHENKLLMANAFNYDKDNHFRLNH